MRHVKLGYKVVSIYEINQPKNNKKIKLKLQNHPWQETLAYYMIVQNGNNKLCLVRSSWCPAQLSSHINYSIVLLALYRLLLWKSPRKIGQDMKVSIKFTIFQHVLWWNRWSTLGVPEFECVLNISGTYIEYESSNGLGLSNIIRSYLICGWGQIALKLL